MPKQRLPTDRLESSETSKQQRQMYLMCDVKFEISQDSGPNSVEWTECEVVSFARMNVDGGWGGALLHSETIGKKHVHVNVKKHDPGDSRHVHSNCCYSRLNVNGVNGVNDE